MSLLNMVLNFILEHPTNLDLVIYQLWGNIFKMDLWDYFSKIAAKVAL